MPNVVGSGAPCANAMPFSFNMASSTGSHRATPMPETAPRRTCLRETLRSFSIAMLQAPYGQCGGGTESVADDEVGEEVAPEVVARRERLNQAGDLRQV